jgi:ribose transport system substrate-binding protein
MTAVKTGLAILTAITVGAALFGLTERASRAAESDDYVAQAKHNMEAFFAGTDRALPNAAPKPAAGKKVWVIACAMAGEGCANPANAAAFAGRKLGWDMTVQDGRLDPNVYNSLIRTAITAKVDAIILIAVDCGPAQNTLAQAVAAGIKIIGVYSLDCSQKYFGGKPQFTAQVSYCAKPTSDEATLEACYERFLNEQYTQNMADYTITKLNGKAEAIVMQEDDSVIARIVGEANQAWLAKCPGCIVHVVPFTGLDLLNGRIQSIAAAALTRYLNANAVIIPYDAAGFLGVSGAVKGLQASGRNLELIGVEGLSGAISQIKSGSGQTFATGSPASWLGWAGVDALVRVFAGEPQVDEGIGVAAIDKDHNLPTSTPDYNGNARSDWQANFLKIWGVQ